MVHAVIERLLVLVLGEQSLLIFKRKKPGRSTSKSLPGKKILRNFRTRSYRWTENWQDRGLDRDRCTPVAIFSAKVSLLPELWMVGGKCSTTVWGKSKDANIWCKRRRTRPDNQSINQSIDQWDEWIESINQSIEYLGSDEDILPFHYTLGDFLLQRLANFLLVAVDECGVDGTVSQIKGVLHGVLHFVGLRL